MEDEIKELFARVPQNIVLVFCQKNSDIYGCTISSLASSSIFENKCFVSFSLRSGSVMEKLIKNEDNVYICFLSKNQTELAKHFVTSRSLPTKETSLKDLTKGCLALITGRIILKSRVGGSFLYAVEFLEISESDYRQQGLLYLNREFQNSDI